MPFERANEFSELVIGDTVGIRVVNGVLQIKSLVYDESTNGYTIGSDVIIGAGSNGDMIIKDQRGHSALVSVFGDLINAPRKPDIMCKFAHGISAFEALSTITGGGSIATTNGQATLNSGAATNSGTVVKSRETVRYLPSHAMYAMFTAAWIGTPASGAKSYIGFSNGNDGFLVGFFDGVFKFRHIRANGSVVSGKDVALANWLDPLDGTGASGLTLDEAMLNIWRISLGHLGVAPVVLEVHNGQFWTPVHVYEYANLQAVVHLVNPYLKIWAECANTTNNTNHQLVTGCWAAGSIVADQGEFNVLDRRFSQELVAAVTSTERPFFSIRNKTNYPTGGLENFVRILLSLMTGVCEGSGTNNVKFRLYRGATLTTGVTTYADYDSVNSCVEINTGATGFSGGTEISYNVATRNAPFNFDLLAEKLITYPNQSITLTVQSASNVTADFMLRWAEEH